jgi:hypothetical protein
MAPAVSRGFDLLSVEIVDIITEKVRQECSKSFQALEKTSKNLRDSARRCSKTVVVTLFEKSEQHAVRTKGEKKKGNKTGKREVGRSKHPDDLLSTEMSMRPGLKGLVVLEPHFGTELALGSISLVSESVLCCLPSLSWMTCMIKDFGDSWKQVFTWLLLPASKGSLQKLTLTGCVHRSRNCTAR